MLVLDLKQTAFWLVVKRQFEGLIHSNFPITKGKLLKSKYILLFYADQLTF